MDESNISQREGTVIVSCDVTEAEDIILKILGAESLPDCVECCHIKGYPWNIETKYYNALINLYALKEKAELDTTFYDTIKGVIFYFDSQKHSSFEEVLSWMPYIKNIEAEVQLLVCNNFNYESESYALEKKNILDWCIKNEYELVELNPPHESDDEDECAFKDAKGYGRIIQALQAHPWSDLKMKTETEKQSGFSKTKSTLKSTKDSGSKESNSNNSAACGSETDEEKSNTAEDKKETSLFHSEDEEKWLNNLAGGEPGEETFEAMFSKFASMKEKAQTLNGEERKKFAEKVAISFWRAMGGDEDEIADLDDLED